MGKQKLWIWGAAVCLLALVLCGGQYAQGAIYSDIEGHWAQPAIERWAGSGILNGYPNGSFGPNDPVTRGQLSEILYRVWGCGPKDGRSFPDVARDAWYHDAVTTMNAYGVTLSQGKNLCPDQPLTREEAFYMVAKAFDVGYERELRKDPATQQVFQGISDAGEVEPSYWSRINDMMSRGYLRGSGGALRPKALVSRAEIVTVIDSMFDLFISEPGTYTLNVDQTALVTCPGVTLNYVPTRTNYDGTLYLMAKADHDIVLTQEGGSSKYIRLDIRGVSEDGASWTDANNEFQSINDRGIHLSKDFRKVDLRFAGGSGLACCPYLIETPEQFLALSDTDGIATGMISRSSPCYFSLQNDIELPKDLHSMSIPSLVTPYILGNGHTVTFHVKGGNDLLLERYPLQKGYGLFMYWGRGECRDLVLAGSIDITVDDAYPISTVNIGGLVSKLDAGELINCTSKLDIKVTNAGEKDIELCAGGLVGFACATKILNCTGEGTVTVRAPQKAGLTRSPEAGGLVGVCTIDMRARSDAADSEEPPALFYIENGEVVMRGCGSSAAVSVQGGDHAFAGGLVGLLTAPTAGADNVPEGKSGLLEHCWSTATVSASNSDFQSDCGGIVGQIFCGTVRASWAKPSISVEGHPAFQNTGGIAGSLHYQARIEDCWSNASSCPVSNGPEHRGGISGRMWGGISNCYAIGAEKFAAKDGISFAQWTSGPVTNCLNMTAASQAERQAFYRTCGWDFDAVWDKSGTYPILRGCDAAAQRAAQAQQGAERLLES